MNIYFLKYFYDTIRLQSVSKAAVENHVTKSAISQGITQLEKSLQATLLTHSRNKIKITEQGQILFHSCQDLFKKIVDIKLALHPSKTMYQGNLVIACSHSIGLNLLPLVLPLFRKKAPNVVVTVYFGHTGTVKEWLQQNRADVGLVLDNDDLSSCILTPLYKGNFALFESKKRKAKKPITSSLFSPARHEVFIVKKAFKEKYGYELKTDMELCSWEVICQLICENYNVGLIPDYLLLNREKARLLRRSQVAIQVPYTIHAASLEPLSKNGSLFVQLLSDYFALVQDPKLTVALLQKLVSRVKREP
jgi:LysR family transcriptional regulator, carnitine catabolism transcriptional activator